MKNKQTFEVIKFDQVPFDVRIKKQYCQIYAGAKRLLSIGTRRAVRVPLGALDPIQAQKKAHVAFRRSTKKMRTKVRGGFLYMWIEDKVVPSLENVPIPTLHQQGGDV